MNRFIRTFGKSGVMSSRLGSLLLLFQRSPLVQILFPEARLVGGAGLGELTKWTATVVAGLGAFDTVAGATTVAQLLPVPNSTTVPATSGVALSFQFQCTGTESAPKSWTVTGALPNGLNHTNATNSTLDSITGIPTQTGSFPITVKAWEESNGKGNVVSQNFTINVAVNPAAAITAHPASVTINSGQTTKLTVSASGAAPLTYQWYQGNSGVTGNPVGNNSASFTTPALSNNTKYWVKVSNSANPGGDNSNTATVSVNQPAAIAANPASVTINSGQSTTLNVSADGTAPIDYQWYQGNSGNTATPVGNNSPNFTTPNLSSTTKYWVKVSNIANAGGDNSTAATVSVNQPAAIETDPTAVTINSGQTTTLNVTATGTEPISYQWYEGNRGTTTNPVGTNSSSFTTPALGATTKYWVKVTNVANSGGDNSLAATVSVNQPAAIFTDPASVTINSGQTTTLSVTASGTEPIVYQWYEGSSGTTTTPVGTNLPSFTTPVLSADTSYWVKVTNVANPGGDSSLAATVSVNQPAAIVADPSSVTINSGQTTMLSVTASGTEPLVYQWYEGPGGTTTNPVGTNSAVLTTPTLNSTTEYWVKVTNMANAAGANSNSATVTVRQPAAIVVHPVPVTITSGETTTLSVTASGTGPLSYQWFEGDSGVTSTPVGTDSESFTTPALAVSSDYWVRVSNSANPSGANSNAAAVTVLGNDPASISVHPVPVSINSGTSTILQVTATGTEPMVYQWYEGASGVTTTPVGTNSASFTTPALSVETAYWVRVTNAPNPSGANSNSATVSINQPAAITVHPAPVTIDNGATTTLSVTATGTGPLVYQWYQGTSGVTTSPVGTDSKDFTTPALSASTSYWVKVSNVANTDGAISDAAAVTVNAAQAVAITAHPASADVNRGETATLSVAATGTGPLSYQWYEGISGVTTSPVGTNSFTFTTPALSSSTGYWVRVGNGVGAVDSETAVLTVLPMISVEQPANSPLSDGGSVVGFGDVGTGTTLGLDFTIRNAGVFAIDGLAVTKAGANPDDFEVTGPLATTVGAGAKTKFTVVFRPGSEGLKTASIQVTSTVVGEEPFDIQLTGNGIIPVPEIAVEQPAGSDLKDGVARKSFGTSGIGIKGTTRQFTIRNAGTAKLSRLAITLDGAQASDFTVTPLVQTSLNPKATTTFKVTFKPSAAGTRNAAIHIKSNDANENPFDIKLSGVGAVP